MAEPRRQPPSEAEIERWSREDADDWGELDPAELRIVHPENVDPNDVAAVRRAVGMSQAQFAKAFGVSLATLRRWEQGVRRPRGPAQSLLRVIAREPAAARRALS